MALKVGTLQYDIDVDTRGLNKAVSSTNRLFSRLGRTIAAALSFEAARRTVLLAEKMTLLDVRIKNVTKSTKEFTKSQQELIRTANSTGQSFQATVQLFERLKIASKDIGASNDQVLRLTETVQKLGVVGGSSVDEMKFSLRQFSQAMAEGLVRAQEFNSIVENTPFIMDAIADSMGVSIGQLRQMSREGKLLSKDVFNALLAKQDEVVERFEKFPLTTSRAMQAIENNFGQAIKKINDEIEASPPLAKFFQEMANKIPKWGNDFLRAINTVQAGWVVLTATFEAKWDIMLQRLSLAWDQFKGAFTSGGADIEFSWEILTKTIGFLWSKALDTMELTYAKFIAGVAEVADATGFDDIAESLRGTAKEFLGASHDAKALKTEIEGLVVSNNKRKEAEANANEERIAAHKKAVAEILEKKKTAIGAAAEELDADLARINAVEEAERKAREAKLPGGLVEDKQAPSVDGIEVNAGVTGSIEQLMADMGNETQAILNALRERNKKILDATEEGETAREDLIRESRKKFNRDMLAFEKQNAIMGLQQIGSFLDQLVGVLAAGGKKQNALYKGLFLAMKAIQVATIIAETEVGAAKAIGLMGPFGLPLANVIRASGYASAGLVAGLAIGDTFSGGGRVSGGDVFAGAMHPVNENGNPEILVQGGRQFLLPGSSGGKIVPTGGTGMGGSAPSITINNNGPAIDVESSRMSDGEIVLAIKAAEDTAVSRVDTSLASQRGSTYKSLREGADVGRNIRG